MPSTLRTSALALAACLLAPLNLTAKDGAVPPPGQRAAAAQTVVIGKVVSIEDKTVTAKCYPGDPEKADYQIAVVKVDDAVVGAKGLTHVRVGFIPADTTTPRRRPAPVQLNKGDEVILFLQPHFEANFQIAPYYYDVVFKTQDEKGFEKVAADVKRAGKFLSEPMAGLTSKEAKDRADAAMLLVVHYRSGRASGQKVKEEPIDAKESKLILEALAAADWGNGDFRCETLTPAMAFASLNLTPKDGWFQPQNLKQFPDAAKKWLKENAGTYRIMKFVPDKEQKDK
jgi:hypothetical protein